MKLPPVFHEQVPLWYLASAMAVQSIVVVAAAGKAAKKIVDQANDVIQNQQNQIEMLKETSHYLLDHVPDEVATEANRRLDYWRVVFGQPIEDDGAE